MKLFKLPIFFLAAALLLCACGKQPEAGENLEFTMTRGSLDCSGSYFWIGVQADEGTQWSLSLDFGDVESWATLRTDSGSGNDLVACDYQSNSSESARLMTITLTGSTTSVSYSISQSGNVPASPISGWMELPAIDEDEKDNCHTCFFTKNYLTYRNYTIRWSAENRLSLWVAYPLNKSYMNGSSGRTNAWSYDPSVSVTEQACLYRGYKWPASRQTDRGHQLPSADRLCCTQANEQTFYFTNMTPQYDDFNTGIWSTLEGAVRSYATKSDTLYVVTGAVMGSSPVYAYDNNGAACPVPSGYYKALLSYSKNTSYGFSGWQAACFIFDQNNFSSATLKNSSLSVRSLESKLDIDFFPNLKDKIGKELYDKVEQQDPTVNSFWW